jgi:hypothetical protein
MSNTTTILDDAEIESWEDGEDIVIVADWDES